jgi:hypothetical protein
VVHLTDGRTFGIRLFEPLSLLERRLHDDDIVEPLRRQPARRTMAER